MPQTTPHRRGRPPGTSARDLELVALRLFTQRGYDHTTVEDVAAAAGVSRRTFFRYFDSKADVLWHAFDDEVLALRDALAATPADLPLMDSIRTAVISVNHYTAADIPELRTRIHLISTVPALQASAATHYDAWEQAVIVHAARHLGKAADDLLPLAVGRATLAVCRAAYEYWVNQADADLTTYIDTALHDLAHGFTRTSMPAQRGLRSQLGGL